MSDLIRLLPDHVANQIAAGEVVQRPASVVKELLENSVDAGAGRITLVLKDAGRTLVQVVDDGRGMSDNDARLCWERHATSKIRAADDLLAIRTKGFRGEALASIAAVAQVEMRTRTADNEVGVRVTIDGSRLRAQEAATGPAGTAISVRNLFFNVPARRQFLKTDAVELKHCIDEFQRVALAHPGIGFTVHHNEEEIFHLDTGNERQRIVGIFGRKYDERLVPVEEATEDLQVHGFIGKPEFAKRTRGEQFFFVNGRYIRSGYLEHAVRGAFDELIAKENVPSWYLFLELDPARIDINIHPTKTEIKFRDDRTVYAIVRAAVRRALGRFNIAPSLDFEQETAFISAPAISTAAPARPAAPAWRPNDLGPKHHVPASAWQQLLDVQGPVPTTVPMESDEAPAPLLVPMREHEGAGGERPVFQLHGRYVLAQVRSGFIVVDQRRARERILYEQALKHLENGAGHCQAQLFPRNVELSPADHTLVQGVLPELRALGFDLQPMGGRTLTVNGMPAEAADEDPAHLLESVLEQLKQEQAALKNERHAALARSMARGMAPRDDRRMDTREMHDLIDRLFACAMPYSTPGGKPVLVNWTTDELNERFGR